MLGLRLGVLYRELMDGKTVLAQDGRVIHPDEVVSPLMLGEVVFVVDCISVEDVERLPDAVECDMVVHCVLVHSAASKVSP
jgi:hypothetical protein